MTELGSPPVLSLVKALSVDLGGEHVRPDAESTSAAGSVDLTFMRLTGGGPLGGDIILDKMHFEVRLAGIDSVTAVHLHGPAAPDAVGTELASLFESIPGTGSVTGLLVADSIPHVFGFEHDDDRVTTGASVSYFVSLLDQGQMYVDVHTRTHPDGEIRGNIP